MKATLEFNLPEEACEHNIASNAMNWSLTSFEMDNILRNYLKYGHDFKSATEALEHIREFLHLTLEGYNLTLDMIE